MPSPPSATFSIAEEHAQLALQNEFGVGNALRIDEAAIVSNMNAVQGRNFCVEMETGKSKKRYATEVCDIAPLVLTSLTTISHFCNLVYNGWRKPVSRFRIFLDQAPTALPPYRSPPGVPHLCGRR